MDTPKGSDLQQPKSREIVFFKEEASSNRQNLGSESIPSGQDGSLQSAHPIPSRSAPTLPPVPLLQCPHPAVQGEERIGVRLLGGRAEGHGQGKE